MFLAPLEKSNVYTSECVLAFYLRHYGINVFSNKCYMKKSLTGANALRPWGVQRTYGIGEYPNIEFKSNYGALFLHLVGGYR